MQHPWIKEGLVENSLYPHNANTSIIGRGREEDEEGAKAIAMEESPKKIMNQPKVSLNKVLNFNLTNDRALPDAEIDEAESLGSTPESEGNFDFNEK